MRAIMCFALMLMGIAGAFALEQKDPYAWLEDVHGKKPLEWVAAQNKLALDKLKADPRYDSNYKSVLSVLDAPDRIPYAALDHGFAYNFWQDAKNPKGVWRRTTIAEYQKAAPHWDVLLDVDALAKAEKENWVFKGAEVAPGEGRALVRLSRGGGDAVVVREFDLKTRHWAADGFFLLEAKTDVTWRDDNTILFATAKDGATKSGYARIVRQWQRGTPVASAAKLYDAKVEDVGASPVVFHTRQGDVALVIRSVSFFEREYFRLDGGKAVKLDLPLSANLQGVFDGAYLALLREDFAGFKKGALVAFRPGGANQLVLDTGPRASIENVGVGRDKLYATVTKNVIGAVHVFTTNGKGWSDKVLALPGSGSPAVAAVNDYGPEAMFSFENYLIPPTLYFDGGNDAPKAIKALPARFDASQMVTEQFEATSKDGTKIPYFVTRPKVLHGTAPTILYGYGGFEVSLTPAYSANAGRLWVSKGGIYVVANIRGGGEFGPAWHEAAEKLHRQRAFDDFAAVANDLIARKLTTPKQLGIMGGSNGGLLVSTVMTQIPDKLGAVVCQVPLIDMIAYTHIGAGASWVGEYGDPANAKERDYILTYSPYQNVKKEKKYPPVFFVTATSDDRVTPVHARKMAAKMEEQGHEVLFYENTDGGHAAAADHRQAAEMWALSYVYLAQKLGLK
ncbi:MAG: S9 family peptidase [Alphaproteobacteria bacterium]|nr:S9 family peptidase [Alphaproteobacteria bacterium]